MFYVSRRGFYLLVLHKMVLSGFINLAANYLPKIGVLIGEFCGMAFFLDLRFEQNDLSKT
jgi:hypothetical protein